MWQKHNLVLGSLLLGLCLVSAVWAQVIHGSGGAIHMPGVPEPRATYGREPSIGYADQSWVNQKWTGDERPYLRIKADIDAAVTHGTSPATLADRYPHPMQPNTLDPKGWFACAYATQLVLETQHSGAQIIPLYNLRRIQADCYLVARLRFLLTQEMEPNNDHLYLVPLARRFLKRDPNDYPVRHAMIRALCSRPAGLVEAVRLAQDDVDRAPMNPERHRTLAGVYEDMYIHNRGHDATFRQMTIREYEAFLKYAKPDDEFRPRAVQLIHFVKTDPPW